MEANREPPEQKRLLSISAAEVAADRPDPASFGSTNFATRFIWNTEGRATISVSHSDSEKKRKRNPSNENQVGKTMLCCGAELWALDLNLIRRLEVKYCAAFFQSEALVPPPPRSLP